MQGKVVFKEVTNVQYCACMNPRAGSFSITPRMQRHFSTFAVQMPSPDIVKYVIHAPIFFPPSPHLQSPPSAALLFCTEF